MAFSRLFSRRDRRDQIPEPNPEFEEEWRPTTWSNRDDMLNALCGFKPNSKVNHLNIVLHGPAGAGKSAFINSVQSAVRGRMCGGALASSVLTEGTLGESFTQKFKKHMLKDKNEDVLPVVISDIKGIESDESHGARNDDLLQILKGKVKEGYKFNNSSSISEEDVHYNSKPTLGDKVHCLVFVLSAATISLISDSVYTNMREIRKKARDLDIPQVVIMTNVDKACPLVGKDLKKIYTSKKIKEKMEECHHKIGIPMNCIFPVKNYSEELDTSTEKDILILKALTYIVNFANDSLDDQTNEKN